MEKIKVVFVNYQLICGGAEQALFDLICLMDKEKFDVSVFIQNPGGEWEEKFREAGIRILYDYSCRKATFNPITKMGNIVKKLKTQKALNNEGEGLLDVVLVDGADIVVSYSAWCKDWIAFKKGAKTVKYIHGDPATNPPYHKEAVEKRHVLEKYDRIVCVSDAACRSFKEVSGLTEGVEMHFMAPPDEDIPYYVTYAPYFSLLPFGYANFGPLLTAILASVAFILSVIRLFVASRRLSAAILVITIIAMVISVMPLLLVFTFIGGAITALLVIAGVLAGVHQKLTKGEESDETK